MDCMYVLKRTMSSLAFCTRTAVDVSRIDVAFSTSVGHIITSCKLTGYTLLCDNIDYALQCIQTNKKPKKTIPLSLVIMNLILPLERCRRRRRWSCATPPNLQHQPKHDYTHHNIRDHTVLP